MEEGMESTSDVTPETESSVEGESDTQDEETQEETSAKKVSKQPKLTEEELEEISLGSVKGKVPKALAKAIKDYERGVQGKFQEVAQVKKQAQDLVSFAKQNPREFFKQLQIDPYDFAEATLAEKIEMMQMSPEQKRLMESEAELKKYKEQEETVKKSQEEEKRTKEESQVMQSLDKEIAEAFASSGLPRHQIYIQQIAATMLSAEKRGEVLSAQEAAVRVKERFNNQLKEVFQNLEAQDLQALLGDDVLKKLRQAEIKRVTDNTAPTLKSASRPGGSAPVTKTQQQAKKPMSEREWKAWHESLRSGN